MTVKPLVLVTGANGFVGRALCEHFVREGRHVRAVVRESAEVTPGAEPFRVHNFGLETDWSEALSGVSCVVSLAARVHVMDDTAADPLEAFRRVNVHGTLRLAHEAARCGVRRFVFVSSVKVNGEATDTTPFTEHDDPRPVDPYGLSKWEAEQALLDLAFASGMEVVIVRPPLVYGPGVKANFERLMRWASRDLPLPLGAVHNRRSMVALDNLVSFLSRVVDHPAAAGETFLVADREAVSTADLYRRLAWQYGRSGRLLRVPVWVLRALGRVLRRTDEVDRLVGSLEVSTAKATRVLGWCPPLDLDEGLSRAVRGSMESTLVSATGSSSPSTRSRGLYYPVKRALDIMFAVFLGLAFLPILLLIALLIRLDSPGPALFIQWRAGHGHHAFPIYKFRTMYVDTPDLSTEDMRVSGLNPITRVGHLLRKTSLDELPQLLNVLRGEMSFVGPRPALMTQKRVLRMREANGVDELRPGITGLAQVTGRDDLDDEEKVGRDALYLSRMSLCTDLQILLLTIRAVFGGRGTH
ncbi:hybrid nucleoside-diphosphate sugar epimerase/sugar transferase [Deinococcus peraridilitoris]|uniref:Glycosyl transferase possibly involved in lipopolysaccharide synthesis n=1 Tax=Deinococcus peraridilitoris (strain DSM 19664 / LMG 22246 / CIP 109416 / KR-200) TaxID=937777 RepID=K9ZXU7_DEIPD|nr:hybrid nucleoside-diphosphate sugar epimerase/sugar transferase [Deinococcus peraridilitoris]AFZ66488.1 glycosyl transferase possibly involved in lipopolysaccharide synthesis [Deinococcus peraridilitoris DSM 19664]